MDLGNLLVHLNGDSTGVVKAFSAFEKSIEDVAKTSKVLTDALKNVNKATEETEKKISIVSQAVQSMSKVFSAAKGAFDIVIKGLALLEKGASFLFWPLKKVIEGVTLLGGVLIPLGVTAVKTAGSFDMLHKRLELIINDAEKTKRIWAEGIAGAGFFDVQHMINAQLKLERVGISGKEAMETIRDAAVILDETIDEVATSVVRMSAGTLRGLRLMGINFVVEGSTYHFQYRDKFNKTMKETVTGLSAAQRKILEIFKAVFGGAYENVKNTLPVLTKTMMVQYSLLKAAFGEGIRPVVVTLFNDVISGMKALIPYAEKYGREVGAQLEKARQAIMEVAAKGITILKHTIDAVKSKGIGVVIIEAFTLGVKLFTAGFIAALKLTLPIWKVIGTVLADSIMEALYKTGMRPFKNIGEIKHARDISESLSPLSLEQLQKVADEYKVPLEKSTSVSGIYYTLPAEVKRTKQELQDALGQKFKSSSYEDIEKWFQDVKKLVKAEGDFGLSANIGKHLTEVTDEAVASVGETLDTLKEQGISYINTFDEQMIKAGAGSETFASRALNAWDRVIVKSKEIIKAFKDAALGESEEFNILYSEETLQAGKQMDAMLKNLKQEGHLIGLSNRERNYQSRLIQELNLAEIHYTNILDENGKELSKESEQYKALVGDAKKLTDEGRRRIALYKEELELQDKLQRGWKGYGEIVQNWVDNSTNMAENFGQATTKALDGASNAFADFVNTGKADFRSLAVSVLKDIQLIMIKLMVAKALMSFTSSGGGFDWKSSILSSVASALVGGINTGGGASIAGGANVTGAGGAGFSANPTTEMGFARGSIFNQGNIIPFASGAMFDINKILPFASGHVVNTPTIFPMAEGNIGLMGEAGPEAIMPLARGAGGQLGVRAEMNSSPTINNIKVVNVMDKSEILAALTGPAGEKTIVNAIKRNKGIVSGILR